MTAHDRKATRTFRYLTGTSQAGGFDGRRFMPKVTSPPGRHFVSRLSFAITPKLEYAASDIARTIADNIDATLFFSDTSLFDDRTDPKIWDALLSGTAAMVIVPQVRQELMSWLTGHPAHPAAKAIAREDPAIHFLSYDQFDAHETATLTYYANLLGIRKHLVRVKELEFENAHGRAPDEPELARLKQEIHETYGPRAYLLARKGATRPKGPTFYTDELLVCLAVMTAIRTGREVVVLTKDEDILEQFYKLQWLLDTHYRGMLLADLYAADPLRFVFHALPKNVPYVDEAFQGDNNVLIERSPQLLDAILPQSYAPVPVYCWVLGNRLTEMAFLAEREMERLLQIKGKTGGLNSDRLAERNCHIWLAPLDVPQSLRGCAAIVSDRRLPLRSAAVQIPSLDIQQAVLSQENFQHITEFHNELVTVPPMLLS